MTSSHSNVGKANVLLERLESLAATVRRRVKVYFSAAPMYEVYKVYKVWLDRAPN